MRRKLSKLALVASFGLALTFHLSCSSDGDNERNTDVSSSSEELALSSSSVTARSSSSSVNITEGEACDSYWRQAINQIANQCSNATINITRAPSPSQTYGYDCSLTQNDVDFVVKEVCTQTPPTPTCDLGCINLMFNNSAINPSSFTCSALVDRIASQIASTCKCTTAEVYARSPCI